MSSVLSPPISPVVISIAHAGRDYGDLGELARVPINELRPLEDRYADALVDAAGPHRVIMFDRPRAWIDVNRETHDLDSSMVADVPARILSPRARGGLGLIPRRLAGVGELWRRPFTRAELDARLYDYRRFHAAVGEALAAAKATHGRAILVDLHSMPPLGSGSQIVLGNAHNAACDRYTTETVMGVLRQTGFKATLNEPYAGGAIIRRHGRPALGVQALQLELDRTLYLDQDQPGSKSVEIRELIGVIAATLATESALPIAAE